MPTPNHSERLTHRGRDGDRGRDVIVWLRSPVVIPGTQTHVVGYDRRQQLPDWWPVEMEAQ